MQTYVIEMTLELDHIRILTVELQLACKEGSCEAIFSNTNIFNDISHIPLRSLVLKTPPPPLASPSEFSITFHRGSMDIHRTTQPEGTNLLKEVNRRCLEDFRSQ